MQHMKSKLHFYQKFQMLYHTSYTLYKSCNIENTLATNGANKEAHNRTQHGKKQKGSSDCKQDHACLPRMREIVILRHKRYDKCCTVVSDFGNLEIQLKFCAPIEYSYSGSESFRVHIILRRIDELNGSFPRGSDQPMRGCNCCHGC